MTLTISSDDSRFIYASISSLEEHLIWGSLLAAVVVMFFIRNLRAVIISALAIPASIVATFTLMRGMDFTLNNMTLLGLTLAVGIVIDDAIVVLENIFRYIEEKKCTPFEAAIQGTREVALPVMATTLSLIVIFLPVAFMTGYARRFIYPFGWTMAFAILVSMLVSFTLTPMLSSRFLKLADAEKDLKTKDRGFFHWIDGAYARSLEWALAHPTGHPRRHGRRPRADDSAEPDGRPHVHSGGGHGRVHRARRHAAGDVARGHARRSPQQVVKEIGGRKAWRASPTWPAPTACNHFHIMFYLKPSDERDVSQEEVMTRVRQVLPGIPGWRRSSRAEPAGGGGGGGGNFADPGQPAGPGYRSSCTTTRSSCCSKAQQLPSLVDAKSDFSNASPEVHVVGGSGRGRPISACGSRPSAARCG